jgi:RHS repeat-associated protein
VTVNENGDVVHYDDYYPFGLQMPGRSLEEDGPKERFTGHELDDETGLLYAGARYLNPVIGRWMSVDPLAEKFPGASPYDYALNNPIKLFDPDGKAPAGCPPFCGPAGQLFEQKLRGLFDYSIFRSGNAVENIGVAVQDNVRVAGDVPTLV